jgi:hypothetical protein
MSTCTVYKGLKVLGTGSIANGGSVTGFTLTDSAYPVFTGRNVSIMVTSSTDAGKTFNTRVTADGGTSLTIWPVNPWAT